MSFEGLVAFARIRTLSLIMSFAGSVAFARIRTLFHLLGTLALPSRTAVLESWKAGLLLGSPA
jgi:hypothetical protein